MKCSIVAVLLLAACLYTAQAQTVKSHVADKYKLFHALVKCAGAEKAVDSADLKVTVLAPTDAAITAFLKEMGITAEAAVKEEALCDALVGYHIIPAVAKAADITGKSIVAPTLIKGNTLTIGKIGSKVIVTDAQGNKAEVVGADGPGGKSVIHGVSKVLLSKYVFTSTASAMKFYAKPFSTLAAALTKAGLLSTVAAPGFTGTVLAPGNRAFAKVPGALTLSADKLKSVLLYHVLPEARSIPQEFTSGRSYATLLKDQKVKYTLTTKKTTMKNGQVRNIGTASFTSTSGNTAITLGHNIYAGKAIIHAVNAVLMPSTGRVTERGASMATMGRRLLGQIEDTEDMQQLSAMNDAEMNTEWAAMSGNPEDVAATTSAANRENQGVGIPTVAEDQW